MVERQFDIYIIYKQLLDAIVGVTRFVEFKESHKFSMDRASFMWPQSFSLTKISKIELYPDKCEGWFRIMYITIGCWHQGYDPYWLKLFNFLSWMICQLIHFKYYFELLLIKLMLANTVMLIKILPSMEIALLHVQKKIKGL